jgi:methionyl-tRNA synthetase
MTSERAMPGDLRRGSMDPARLRRALLTSAPPTPNGDLHLGHIGGPYMAADVQKRYLRMRGVEAYYLCGSDDNLSWVLTNGRQYGMTAPEAADHFSNEVDATLHAARIEMDVFARPNASAFHVPMVQEFVRRLYEQGELVARTGPSPYCASCQRYLYEAYIRGNCPHCGSLSGGNYCEDCALPNDCIDLAGAYCADCGAAPETREFTRLFFPLSRHAAALERFHREVEMSPHLRALCERTLARGLPDVCISHVADWGIPVGIAGFEGQVIYAWCEMAPRYLAYTAELLSRQGEDPRDWRRFWCADDARVVQCFGFDNGFWYSLFIPALFTAYDPSIRLQAALVSNEFYRLEGKKFSTSRKHAIWGRELLADATPDEVRFYLAYTCPETERTNFTRAGFEEVVRRELIEGWQEWLAGLGAKVAQEAAGAAPAAAAWTPEQRRFADRLASLAADAAAAYEAATFSPQAATRTLCELVRLGRRFGKAEDWWATVPARAAERRTALALELAAARLLAQAAAPLLPDFAARLAADLGFAGPLAWEEPPAWVPAGQAIGRLDAIYFPAIRQPDRAAAAGQPAAAAEAVQPVAQERRSG